MDNTEVLLAIAGVAVAIIGWFIRRDYSRMERREAELRKMMHEVAKEFGIVRGRVEELSKLIDHIPDLKRFFGPKGGQARLWGRLEYDMSQVRKRDHHLINKLTILKGSMELAGIKCGDPSIVWALPDWENYSADFERP